MEDFRRYAQAYLRRVGHPFGSGSAIDFGSTELEEMVSLATYVLAAPVKEFRLANLNVRFESSVKEYLVVSREQAGALTNAIERLAELLEPFLKKLVYLCYPRRILSQTSKPLWHFGMEKIATDLGLVTADLKNTDESYWRQQPLEDANWRIAFVSRHKGAHEAHPYDLVELERIAKAVLTCYLLAARKTLTDPTSKSRDILASARVLQLNELLSVRAQTYRITRDLPDTLEHLRLYEARTQLSLTDEKVRLLFESHLAGNGPIYYFLRSIPVAIQVEWARQCLDGEDITKKMAAAEFLYRVGKPPVLAQVVNIFQGYSYRYKLAFYIRSLAGSSDVPLLWKLHRHKAAVVREACKEALGAHITDRHRLLLERAAKSKSEATRELFLHLGVALAVPEKVEAYRQALNDKNRVSARYALLGLGRVGSPADLERLQQYAARTRLDRWTEAIAIAALALLASQVGNLTLVSSLLADSRDYVVRAGLIGLQFSKANVPMESGVGLYKSHPREVGQVLLRCAGRRNRRALRKLLRDSELDDAAKRVALALCLVGNPSDLVFVLKRIVKSKKKVDFWEQYELVFPMAKKASGAELRLVLRRFINPREFWAYYGEQRPREKMPVAHYDNIPLVKRIVGLCFGEVATRRDIPVLLRMLEHSYWSVYHGAVNGLVRLGRTGELNKLVMRAINRRETGKDIDGHLEAVCALDQSLFAKLPRGLPMEAAFGEARNI